MKVSTCVVENCVETPQTLKIRWPHDPTILLLGIYGKKAKWRANGASWLLLSFTLLRLAKKG